MDRRYQKTIYACFIGYIVQAIVNNFAPLLFLTFQREFQIPLAEITLLVTINFAVQLLVDALAAVFAHKINSRAAMVCSHLAAAAGLILLAVLPSMFPNPFWGLLIAVIIYAIGGGLNEVLVSPIMESCPTENKEKAMSLLHSFYCWGYVGVILISTLYFRIFGIANWKYLAFAWSAVALFNAAFFLKVPIAPLLEEGEEKVPMRQLFGIKLFWLLMIMMVCAGASEQAVSQWASAFAEEGLGLAKAVSDLAGPLMFATFMGISRAFYGKYGEKIHLERFMTGSTLLCIASYLCIVFVRIPVFGLIGCAICGFSVGIFWPGTFSIAAAHLKKGGTALFALLALAGDLGCSGGPTVVGMVSSRFGDQLNTGILAAIVFPLLLLLTLAALKKIRIPA